MFIGEKIIKKYTKLFKMLWRGNINLFTGELKNINLFKILRRNINLLTNINSLKIFKGKMVNY